MTGTGFHVVTGAYGYSGRYIAERLVAKGIETRTLTNSPDRPNPFGPRVPAYPLCFDDVERLAESLRGAAVLYNTYWVRFNHKRFSHASAVENTLRLFEAARMAGVGRVVHTSITNPSENSPFEYFSGKARLEAALKETGLSYAILRPAVLFGQEDILVNNIAWVLRRLPVMGVFGDGAYRLQPIFVEDYADLAVAQGAAQDNVTIDAIGPETFSYRELVEALGAIIGKRRPVVAVPPWFGYWTGVVLGWMTGDVMITREEIGGLMADLLCTDSVPAGQTKLTEWAARNADTLGQRYQSELARRRDRKLAY